MRAEVGVTRNPVSTTSCGAGRDPSLSLPPAPENPGPVCHQVQALRVCDLKQGCLQLQPMQGLQFGEGI